MSQCVPSWDLDDPPPNLSSSHRHLLQSPSPHPQLSTSDYEVAELTWRNGHLSAHGLIRSPAKYPPSKSAGAGTLESVVDQAKLLHPAPAAIDALVPTNRGRREDLASSEIGSCDGGDRGRKRGRAQDTCTETSSTRGTDDVIGFAATDSVTQSPDTENASVGGSRPTTVTDDRDSVSQSQREVAGEDEEKGTVRSTISTKRGRAAAVHNQSERKRRDRINQKMRTLQKLVPNSNKTDKASMLEEVIEYMKQLQAQVKMMGRMSSMSPMMMPMGMQQQFHMAMMAQMAQMGMGMGMMDMASLNRAGPAGVSPVLPAPAFLPVIGAASWDPSAAAAAMPDPFSSFVACPTQPQQQMTLDAYQRMVVMYQQMFQQTQQATNPK